MTEAEQVNNNVTKITITEFETIIALFHSSWASLRVRVNAK